MRFPGSTFSGGAVVDTYVVRICRRDPSNPRQIAGTVERIGGVGRKGFVSPDALINLLISPAPVGGRSADRPAGGTGEKCGSFSEIVELIRVELEGPES